MKAMTFLCTLITGLVLGTTTMHAQEATKDQVTSTHLNDNMTTDSSTTETEMTGPMRGTVGRSGFGLSLGSFKPDNYEGEAPSSRALIGQVGILWNVSNSATLLGFSGSYSLYSHMDGGPSMNTLFIGGSVQHFLSSYEQEGIFVQGDLGYSHLSYGSQGLYGSDDGPTIRVGAGFSKEQNGFITDKKARLQFGASYERTFVDGGKINSIVLDVTILSDL